MPVSQWRGQGAWSKWERVQGGPVTKTTWTCGCTSWTPPSSRLRLIGAEIFRHDCWCCAILCSQVQRNLEFMSKYSCDSSIIPFPIPHSWFCTPVLSPTGWGFVADCAPDYVRRGYQCSAQDNKQAQPVLQN